MCRSTASGPYWERPSGLLLCTGGARGNLPRSRLEESLHARDYNYATTDTTVHYALKRLKTQADLTLSVFDGISLQSAKPTQADLTTTALP